MMIRLFVRYRCKWGKYARFGEGDVKYRRHLLAAGEGCAILLLVWPIGASAPKHGHKGCECWVRLLSGELVENVEKVGDEDNESRVLKRDNVTYINDSIGRHSMCNEGVELAITLHVYSSFEMSGLEEGRVDFDFRSEF
ncbi:hypothetical protein CANINC_004750 [Pichia inconspicua]|uniref:Cysteine dioxygenase n=1 Tax=Pichia inconspicua TaxID=52247 RepID=A0A4T0WV67_9ASCO|nr:hypothetical protein CANINC_004750 [[Candida] inconspicua]